MNEVRSITEEFAKITDVQKLQFLKSICWNWFTPEQLEILRKAEEETEGSDEEEKPKFQGSQEAGA
jgi:hypothetical protein